MLRTEAAEELVLEAGPSSWMEKTEPMEVSAEPLRSAVLEAESPSASLTVCLRPREPLVTMSRALSALGPPSSKSEVSSCQTFCCWLKVTEEPELEMVK